MNNLEELEDVELPLEGETQENPEVDYDEDGNPYEAPGQENPEGVEVGEGGEEIEEVEDEIDDEYIITIKDVDGTEREEHVNMKDIGVILEGANKLLHEREHLNKQVEELSKYNSLINIVAGNPFLRTVYQYTTEGASPRQIIETLYTMLDTYFPDDEGSVAPQGTQQEIQLPADVQEKLSKFDNFVSEREAEVIQSHNFSQIDATFAELGYKHPESPADKEQVGRLLTEVAQEVLKDLYPDKDPGKILRSSKLPNTVMKTIWREVAARSGGKLRRSGAAPQRPSNEQTAKAAVRRVVAKTQGKKPGFIQVGGDVASTTRPQASTAQHKKTTASERAQTLRNFIYGT